MTEAEARDRLGRMIAADVDPTLTIDELSDLVAIARREDSEGRAPSDDDWEPTFDLNAAAAEGWRWKAGRSVPRYAVTLDTESLQRHQVYAHCISQADIYARKVVGTLGVKSSNLTASEDSFQ